MSFQDSDEFSTFDLAEFTEEDFAQIDAQIKRNHQSVKPDDSFEFDTSKLINLSELNEEELAEIDRAIAKANVEVDIEDLLSPWPPTRLRSKGKRRWDAELSLMDKFRRRGILSVSDLVGPAWCEVQFDYGLRQKRFRPIKQRPTSFVSASGKEICVESKIAEKNNERTKQGRAVHKSLEREVRVDELKVDITSEEERWALRLVNMIVSLQLVLDDGFTREMPVFGLVNNEVVIGIVDEVSRISSDTTKKCSSDLENVIRETNQTWRSPLTHQQQIGKLVHTLGSTDTNVVSGSQPTVDPPEPSAFASPKDIKYLLHIIDTKTRVTESIPLHEDTISSRLQVMLYWQLLSDLITVAGSTFDFDNFWKQLGVDPSKVFSTTFLVQANLLSGNDEMPTTCLNTLTKSWERLVSVSQIAGIDTNLELVYRLQPKGTSWKDKNKARAMRRRKEVADEDNDDFAKAIAASLIDMQSPIESGRMDTATSSIEMDVADLELQRALHESILAQLDHPSPQINTTCILQPIDEEPDVCDFKVIGRKEFVYDPLVLHQHINDVLHFWYSTRKPRGVPVSLSRRCNTCEYRNGCEWREQKAVEFDQQKQETSVNPAYTVTTNS